MRRPLLGLTTLLVPIAIVACGSGGTGTTSTAGAGGHTATASSTAATGGSTASSTTATTASSTTATASSGGTGGMTGTGGMAGTGGTTCSDTCFSKFPAGAKAFAGDALAACGCAAGAACSASCTAACANPSSLTDSSPCGMCLSTQEGLGANSPCVASAGAKCFFDPTCGPFAMCEQACP